MLLAAAFAAWIPLLLVSEEADRLTVLVEEMRRLTFAGHHAAVGRLVPAVHAELAKPHPNAHLAWNQVAVYFQTQGDFAEAELAYQRGIRLSEKDGHAPSGLALLLINLATLHLETGQHLARAEVLCRRALKLAAEVYGPGSPEMTNFLYVLAGARLQQGDRIDARRFFQQALDRAGGSRQGEVRGLILANLAYLAALDHQWTQAKESLLESIALLEKSFGPSHPELIRAHLNLARVYEHLKQWAPARASVAKAREITEARLSPGHPLLAEILRTYASIARKTGHGREARDLNRQAKAIAKAQPKDPGRQAWVHIADLLQPVRRQ